VPTPPTKISALPFAVARGKLIAILDNRGWSNAEAGRLFHCAPSYVSMLKSGATTPGLALAARIEEVTGIPCAEWVKLTDGVKSPQTRIDKRSRGASS
jgi:transcriptional regulator with XRE-family HTH domain